MLGKLPGTVIADAGYGGEENYAYLEEEQIHALVKYGTYHKEKSRAWKKDISKIDNWSYDEEEDSWTCAAGQKLTFHYESRTTTESGYEICTRHYRSASCEGCPLKAACTKAKGNREVSVSLTYWRQKNEMRERLRSEEGYELSIRRMIEPESVFGQVKNNRGFRRFLLRGLDKVSLEVGWLCLAHNLLKKVAIDQKRKRDEAGNSFASSRLVISASFQLLASTSEGLLGQLLSAFPRNDKIRYRKSRLSDIPPVSAPLQLKTRKEVMVMVNKTKSAIVIAAAVVIASSGYFLFASGNRGESAAEGVRPAESAASVSVTPVTTVSQVDPTAISIDFGVRSDPPLVKKFAQYNAGTLPLDNYARDIGLLEAVNAQSFRVDLGLGAGLDRDFLAKNVVKGSPDKPVYDFSSVDGLAELLNGLRVLPYYSWAYVPVPLQRDADFRKLNTDIPDWTGKYRSMMKAISGHFREKGIRVGYHEVYNEPDLTEVFFQEPFETYLDLYRAGAKGLREGDPDAVIGGPALAFGESTTNVMSFVEMVEKEKLPLDFFSFHSYWEAAPFPAKLDNIRKVLGWYEDLKTTELHLNELNFVGGRQGADSRLNGYAIVPDIFDVLKELLAATDITMVNWAQFMESAVGDDAYGLIHRDGQKKAAYNAFKIYADMPEERATVSFGDDWESEKEIGVLASDNGDKASALIWNRTDEDRTIKASLDDLPFESGQLRLYRIDAEHASALEGAPEDLEVAESQVIDGRNGEWNGNVPANGVVYLTVNRSAEQADFEPQADEHAFASDVRAHYYFEDREKDNYSFFDRKQWKFYLGTGTSDTARSLVGVTAERLPVSFRVLADGSDGMAAGSDRSAKTFRLDYEGKNGYVRSVVFHDGVYGAGRQEVVEPFGTRKPADEIVRVDDFASFSVEPAKYAPKDWTGRVIASFELCDTGPGTRMEVSLR